MNTSNAREQRANEEIDIELNKCPLVVTDYQDYTNEFQITFNLEAD